MLSSRAHVRIGGIDYMLDESVDGHYRHNFEPRIIPQEGIPGDPGKFSALTELLYWTITDWTGGEGGRVFDPEKPWIYSYAGRLNPRIKGQITGRPERDTTTVATTANEADNRCYLQIAQGAVWLAGNEDTFSSDDYGVTFTERANGITAGDKVSATAGDDEVLYVASRSATNHEIRQVNVAATNSAVITRAAGQPYVGMCVMNGRLYAWTGRKLFELDVFETTPLTLNDTYRKVYDTGSELDFAAFGGSAPGSWWGDCVASENSVIFFVGTEGSTKVFEYKNGRAYPLWNLPFGFTGKSAKVENGVLFIGGHYGGEGTADGFGAVYALPLNSRAPQFVSWVRKVQNSNLQMQEMAQSYAGQVLLGAAKSGKVFIYDIEFDGLTMLDDISDATGWTADSKIGDMVTIGKHRLVAHFQPGDVNADNYYVHRFKNDEPANRENGLVQAEFFEAPEYDNDRPHTTKGLLGFFVNFEVEDATTTSGLLANQRIIVKYYRDGQAIETAGTVTSASAVSGTKGRVWIEVSNDSTTKKYINLEIQVTLDNNSTAAVQLPILKSVTALSTPLDTVETWELILRAKNEPNSNARPSTATRYGTKIRDSLEDLVQNRNIVEFLDGYRDHRNKKFTTHDVVVEELTDIIIKAGEGVTRVRLRSIPVA